MIRLLLDCDGIITDFVGATLDLLAARDPNDLDSPDIGKVEPDRIRKWDMFAELHRIGRERLSSTEVAKWPAVMAKVREKMREEKFVRDIPVYGGARANLRKILDARHVETFIVTSPYSDNPWWCTAREELLYSLGVKKGHVIHAQRKHVVAGDVFVDDKPNNVADWVDEHPDGQAWLWPTPHNQPAQAVMRNLGRDPWAALMQVLHVR